MHLKHSSRLLLHALWSQALHFSRGPCRVCALHQTPQEVVLENTCFHADSVQISLEIWH